MPTHQRLRTDDGGDVQDRREPSVELDEKPTVGVRQPRPTLHLAPQNNQLLPEGCILRLKSALRLEWRSQDAQHKEDQRYHAARIANSLTPPTRMVEIATTGQREVSFDLADFYHNESRLYGVDTLKRDLTASCRVVFNRVLLQSRCKSC